MGKAFDAVGQEDNKFGFGLGKARKDAKPTNNIENLVNIPKDEFRQPDDANKPASREQHTQDVTININNDKKIVNVDK